MTMTAPLPAPDEAPDRSTRNLAVTLGVALAGCGVAFAGYLWVLHLMELRGLGYWPHVAATVVFFGLILAIALFAKRVGGQTASDCSPSARRYQRRIFVASGLYMLLLVAAIGIHDQLHPTGVLAYVVAAAPAVPLIGVVACIGFYLREEQDEFLRAVQAEGALWATGGTLAIASVWGFLEMFGLAAHVPSWAAFPIWCLLLGPGQLLARRRYR